ncbi:hypothetical protein C8J57DRAFT_1231665 [Mycena rebaudengoi]|nr:hypothetical protein C8J57DRAFT_1231665 [Mycena rebaudengoi]
MKNTGKHRAQRNGAGGGRQETEVNRCEADTAENAGIGVKRRRTVYMRMLSVSQLAGYGCSGRSAKIDPFWVGRRQHCHPPFGAPTSAQMTPPLLLKARLGRRAQPA